MKRGISFGVLVAICVGVAVALGWIR